MFLVRMIAAASLLPAWMPAQTPAPRAVSEWIRGAAIPLNTPVAGNGFDDMQPLKKVVGDARIVSLGEATHGTREFFQLKHRMLEFLATEMGFTIFSIEASMPEAYRLNDFVLNGKGDPAQLIKGMYFWTWDTEEVLEMVRWMRKFNESGKGPVQFTGFDMQTPAVANQIVRDFVAKADPEYAPSLAKASTLALATPQAPQQPFGTASATFPIAPALGKTIRFSGYIKTQDVSEYAGFWWRADTKNQPASFANLRDAAPKGTTDWKKYELELAVPANATAIYFGPLLSGAGTAWFDDLQIEINGVPYNDDAFDFTFEGPALRGLNPSMGAFPSRLDGVAHGGKQSLRISRVPAPVNPNAVDPKTAAAEWTKVLDHLETSRGRYVEKGTAREVDWAIQNARVVLQCMQMRGNQVARDTSMAANVKWILDQSPKAKIVLWAHNGHVMTASAGGPMGSALRKMYGGQMVVFGFAFHQGSFQAVSQGGRGLKDFTVPPAPVDSLDATLAANGIPLFALDLRAAPKTGPAGEWFQASHATRSIGSMYPEDSPFALMASQVAPEMFDALLFVEKTTAARKNPGAARPPTFQFRAIDPTPGDTGGVVGYRDPEFGVSVRMPAGWRVGDAFRWGNRETTARLAGPGTEHAGNLYFQMGPTGTNAEEISKSLLARPESKAAQRIAAGLADYKIRQESVERRTVGGRPAMRCIADYTQNGTPMVEYLTWVTGENANALFFAMVPAAQLDALRQRVDPIVESLKLP